MKRLWYLILIALCSFNCDPDYSPEKISQSLKYFKDPATKLCFAYYVYSTSEGTEISITYVPCDSIEKNVEVAPFIPQKGN